MDKEKKEGKNNKEKLKEPLKPYFAKRTFAQKAADKVTIWAGSWTFIFGFISIVIIWVVTNAYFIANYGKKSFDQYPFILLNLILSMIAALQAPVILMSQNRQGEIDRIRSEYDYAVNRRSEREIKELKKLLLKMRKEKSK